MRGVGKTTTARILARALNYQKADGSGAPTTDPRTPACIAARSSRAGIST